MTQIKKQEKPELVLITIVRSDIDPGYQVAQSVHAIADFAEQHYQDFLHWKKESNTVVCLSVKNQLELQKYYERFRTRTPCVLFYEPDIDEYTSISFIANPQLQKRVSNLPLTLKKQTDERKVRTV